MGFIVLKCHSLTANLSLAVSYGLKVCGGCTFLSNVATSYVNRYSLLVRLVVERQVSARCSAWCWGQSCVFWIVTNTRKHQTSLGLVIGYIWFPYPNLLACFFLGTDFFGRFNGLQMLTDRLYNRGSILFGIDPDWCLNSSI